MKNTPILWLVCFVFIYSAFVYFVDVKTNYGTEIVASSAFCFALFSAFFIARQNDRHTRISTILADRDGTFSYLYRISGLVPRIQEKVRGIIRDHYEKILANDDWAYNETHPSMTITKLTETFGSISESEAAPARVSAFYRTIWNSVLQLQQLRKRIIAANNERLGLFPWFIIIALAGVLLFSFDFIPSDTLVIDIMKVAFGTAVFAVVILIKQLDEMTIFGKDFSEKIAQDVLRVLHEIDAEELKSE
jgi:hypothetical protein